MVYFVLFAKLHFEAVSSLNCFYHVFVLLVVIPTKKIVFYAMKLKQLFRVD